MQLQIDFFARILISAIVKMPFASHRTFTANTALQRSA